MRNGHESEAQGGGACTGRCAEFVADEGLGRFQVITSFLAAGGDSEVRASGRRSAGGGEIEGRRAVGAESSSLDGSLTNAVAAATLR